MEYFSNITNNLIGMILYQIIVKILICLLTAFLNVPYLYRNIFKYVVDIS